MDRICTRCVMDTTDPDITFDADGVCNHCRRYDLEIQQKVFSGSEGRARLEAVTSAMKKAGAGRRYDCIIGLSGGVDSSYTAYLVKQLGLRTLAVHLDNGWDSELAVQNIENLVKKLDIDLYTYVINWEEFKDLQLSFLRASTPDSEVPTDQAIAALMFQAARSHGVKHVVSGANDRTESHLPQAWSQGQFDWGYIRSVHRRHGKRRLTTYPYRGLFTRVRDALVIRWVEILNYVDYVKKDAMKTLERELGWKYYGGKHYESIYTRFYQGHFLPKKFGFDKRKVHLSSLVCSGEINRDTALKELQKDPYPPELQRQDTNYVCKKLGLTESEFDDILETPKRTMADYGSTERTFIWGILLRMYNVREKLRHILLGV